MKAFVNPPRFIWPELCKRPGFELAFLESAIKNTINRVRVSGDEALMELTLQFDKVKIENFEVTENEIINASKNISDELKKSIRLAANNITKFHEAQKAKEVEVETMSGVRCWRKSVAIEKVGLYIPGGSAPLFSTLLMLGIPAKLAGCKEIVLCSPPNKEGNIDPTILFCAKEIGISKIFKVGGAQAIAAMALGTQSIPAVNKIFGPGNQYVTKAKQLVNLEGIAIDLPAGPSEVLVIADQNANPKFVASDLLAQAEHGPDSQVVLVANSKELIDQVNEEIAIQLETLPRKDIATAALQNSLSVEINEQDELIDFVNEYAPEHLIINTSDCEAIAEKISNAGSVFIGDFTPESVGDYASGTNHTLPTNGCAKAYSGVSLESFQKFITFQQLTYEGLKAIGPAVEIMAVAEQLEGHKRAINVRLSQS